MSNLPATQGGQPIFSRFAQRFGLDATKVSDILKHTAFKVTDSKTGQGATDEQMAALLVVADQFNLNPFVKEIYAFPDSTGRGIVPIVPIDGWTRIANEHPQYDGVEYIFSEETVPHGSNKKCPVWMEAVVYRKDRSRPTRVREYLDECSRNTSPWNSHPQRMLRHKAFMQCCRVAFSFGGVYDEDEGERIATARIVDMQQAMPTSIDITAAPGLPSPEGVFDAVIQRTGFADQQRSVDAYLSVCAKHFGKSVEDVKAEICRHPEDFTKAFPAWVKSVEQQKQGKKDSKTTKDKKPDLPAAEPEPAAARAEPQGLSHDPQTGELYGPAASLITCPNNGKQVDELECSGKSCRDGCPEFE